jgi:hypothetical protein
MHEESAPENPEPSIHLASKAFLRGLGVSWLIVEGKRSVFAGRHKALHSSNDKIYILFPATAYDYRNL